MLRLIEPTGPRMTEARLLEWGDIDCGRSRMRVSRQRTTKHSGDHR